MQIPIRHSLVSEAAQSLRAAIFSGEFKDCLPGVRTLSQKLDISVPTLLEAIKVLEKEGLVAVRQGCLSQILLSHKSGARKSRRPKEAFFLIFSPTVLDEISIRDVMDHLRMQGYSVKIQTFGSWRLSSAELERLTTQNRSDCWVLMSSPPDVQKFFADRGLPCMVACGTAQEGLVLPDFEIDFSAIYRHAANLFLNLGHQNFHLLLGERSARKNPASLDAFVSAVRGRLPERSASQLVKTYNGSTKDLQLLLKTLFSVRNKPTGLLVAFVSRYTLVQCWLLAQGYRIPQDVSLICRDADGFMDCLIPSPSYYTYHAKRYSRRMARTIIAILESRRVKKHTLLIPDFFRGDSLGPAPRRKTVKPT